MQAVEYALRDIQATTVFTNEHLIEKVWTRQETFSQVESAFDDGVKLKNIIYFESKLPDRASKPKASGDYRLLSLEELQLMGTENGFAVFKGDLQTT